LPRWTYLLAVPLAFGPVASPVAFAQQAPPAQTQPSAPEFTQAELEQILAPIALYPDDLLTQVLVASTYPLEAVMANRWVEQPANKALKGDALLKALDGQDWDASVKSLVPFPAVLKTMSDQLDWTQKLGDAFLAQQSEVFAAVQALRGRAQTAGTLQTNAQQTVTQDGPAIVIAPTQTNTVCVPAYNPTVAYGAWPYPSYPPPYYPPPAGYYPGAALATGLAFGAGIAITGVLWGWGSPNWSGGNVNINANRFININANSVNANRVSNRANSSNTWQHNPDHRRGVGYTNSQVRQQYRPNSAANMASRDAFRGREASGTPGLGQAGQPRPAPGTYRTGRRPPSGRMPRGRTRAAEVTARAGSRTPSGRTVAAVPKADRRAASDRAEEAARLRSRALPMAVQPVRRRHRVTRAAVAWRRVVPAAAAVEEGVADACAMQLVMVRRGSARAAGAGRSARRRHAAAFRVAGRGGGCPGHGGARARCGAVARTVR
jgi:hypothetical protein